MSRFNIFARKANEIALAAFDEYLMAATEFEAAEKAEREQPIKTGLVSATYQAEAHKRHAAYLEAWSNLDKARRKLQDKESEFEKLRQELEPAVQKAYSVNTEDLDQATLELLKSGSLKAHDYVQLYNAVVEAKNATMVRVLQRYAEEASKAAEKKYGEHDPETVTLRQVAANCAQFDGAEYLQGFDYLTDCFHRCAKHPDSMISAWGRLTGELVEAF